ncbi:hypothetical protein kac65v162_gp192 [Nodularia phage vB_NspS-kac65v162]|uniref:Uncharacterized protein n=3 Tax=Ravarandavirus kac65v151 TaxID=2845689 RepID=A0A482MJR9_9CAUD|nr:hypothetical protein HWC12_gp125 [Nodularia phage vB_NspS-kac65v151]QBQ73222.1 hypothetical protein kac65v151_gp192 [Nodularia phage vB_NspS-kac65v151]QBQ73430.1 hypothetical protein kac65v161_gp192 [Nodularia phage vB_NspS-kac65v161]QBQ73636.1 hypothetical protein kac65v162_gp192 [Nodularia phage vB_NspS-kac65v162]
MQTVVEQHLSSFGHNSTVENMHKIHQKLFHLEAVVNVQSKYAEVLKSLGRE